MTNQASIATDLRDGQFAHAHGDVLLGGVLPLPNRPLNRAPVLGGPGQATVLSKDFVEPFDTDQWTINSVESGSGSASEATGDALGGVLTLTNDDADDDADQIIYVNEAFDFDSGPIWFEARLKVPVTTNIDLMAGLIATEDLTAVTDNLPANGVVWKKDDGDSDLDVASADAGTDQAKSAVGSLDTDWHRYGLAIDNDRNVGAYLDGVNVAHIDGSYVDTDNLVAPSLMVRNGDGNARNLKCDYVVTCQLA